MSQRERDGLKVLHEVKKGHLTAEAGPGAVAAERALGAQAGGAAEEVAAIKKVRAGAVQPVSLGGDKVDYSVDGFAFLMTTPK